MRLWRRGALLVTALGVAIGVAVPVVAGGLLVAVVVTWVGCFSLQSTLREADCADWRMVHGKIRVAGGRGTRPGLFVLELATGELGRLSRGLGIRALENQEGQIAVGDVAGRTRLVVAYGNSRILRFAESR